MRTLRDEQAWFARAITTPSGRPPAVSQSEAEAVLTPGPRLGAMDRLEIYRRAYFSRLVECLADDYGVLRHAIGEESFEQLGRAYVARHPSRDPNLNFFGRHMSSFCREGAPAPFPLRDFAADLARLEWAIVEVIHAAGPEPFAIEALQEIAPEAWASARLVPNPAVRVMTFQHPVNTYYRAVREGASPSVPSPAASAAVVYRTGQTVWRMDLTVPMFDVLSALVAGEPLEQALSRAEPSLSGDGEQAAAQRVLGWFRDWVEAGLFARVRTERGQPGR
jgi:hypothetical protein